MSSGHGARTEAAPPCPGVVSVSCLHRDGCELPRGVRPVHVSRRSGERRNRPNWNDEFPLASEQGKARAPPMSVTNRSPALTAEAVAQIDGWWRAANYLSVGQIYLLANPLLREPLLREHVKPRLLGHFGTAPGLNLIYAHMNRAIRERDIEAIYVTGPGHGGPSLVANAYLEGRYSEVYPDITEDEEGMRLLFRQFSFPGGIPSHVAPETPGSIHEGGELGYSLAHAFGAVFDNPDLLAVCVVGDGEAETGALATSWHSNKFLSPRRRRRGPPHPPPERLQDRQPDSARPNPGARARRDARGLRMAPDHRDGRIRRRARCGRARAVRSRPRRRARRHRDDPSGGPRRQKRRRPAGVADARPSQAQGLDRPAGARRNAG